MNSIFNAIVSEIDDVEDKSKKAYWCQNINSASQNEKIPNRQYMIQQKYRTEGGSHYGKAT